MTQMSKGLMLITVILMDLLVGVEFDLFVPSFPELQSHFNLSPFWVEALLSANFIGYCSSLFFVGGLADRYGRKPIILIGLFIFIFGSILCLWGANYPLLLMGRFLQGVGVASPAILSFLIIADSYSLQKQQFYMAILNGFMNASTAAAPVVGSYISLYFKWQGNFAALLVLGVVVTIMTLLWIPKHPLPVVKESISLRSYIALFKTKQLALLMLCIVFIFVPPWIFAGIAPLLYMEEMGVSLTNFGYYQGCFALVFALGSVIYGLLISKFNDKKMLIWSNYIFIGSLIFMGLAAVLNIANPLLITLAFLPFVIGQIVPSTILYPACINFIPTAKGRVSAILQGGRLILASFGLQLTGYFYYGTFRIPGLIIAAFMLLAIISFCIVLKKYEQLKITTDF